MPPFCLILPFLALFLMCVLYLLTVVGHWYKHDTLWKTVIYREYKQGSNTGIHFILDCYRSRYLQHTYNKNPNLFSVWEKLLIALTKGHCSQIKRCSYVLKLKRQYHSCSVEKGILKNFANFTRKNLCQSLFINKVSFNVRIVLYLKRDSGTGVFLWIFWNF